PALSSTRVHSVGFDIGLKLWDLKTPGHPSRGRIGLGAARLEGSTIREENPLEPFALPTSLGRLLRSPTSVPAGFASSSCDPKPQVRTSVPASSGLRSGKNPRLFWVLAPSLFCSSPALFSVPPLLVAKTAKARSNVHANKCLAESVDVLTS